MKINNNINNHDFIKHDLDAIYFFHSASISRAIGLAIKKFDQQIFRGFLVLGILLYASLGSGESLPEYRLKAAFIFNFIAFTEWPNNVEGTINLCVYGKTRLYEEVETLDGRSINGRQLGVKSYEFADNLKECQVIFISRSAIYNLPHVIDVIRNEPILMISDSGSAARRGIMINMSIEKGRIVFEVNLKAARLIGLNFSSQLLRLAKKVYQ